MRFAHSAKTEESYSDLLFHGCARLSRFAIFSLSRSPES
jgi:hypothetical protein